MAEFALFIGGEFREIRTYDAKPDDISHKGVEWFPVVREYGAPFEGLEGKSYYIRTIDPADMPLPVPKEISDRQFFQQLAILGIITQQEAEDSCAAILPQSMLDLVDALPEQARFSARMLLKGATSFYRYHEMTDTLAWLYGWDSGQVDDLFRAAGKL